MNAHLRPRGERAGAWGDPRLGRFLLWGTPPLAAAAFVSIALIAEGPPLGSFRLWLLLCANAGLSFVGSAAGAFMVPKAPAARVVAAFCGGAFGAAAYVMLTLIADQVVPGI